MNNFKIISWEVTKAILVFTCGIVLIINFILISRINDLNRGIDAIYEVTSDNQQEIRNIIQENKTFVK